MGFAWCRAIGSILRACKAIATKATPPTEVDAQEYSEHPHAASPPPRPSHRLYTIGHFVTRVLKHSNIPRVNWLIQIEVCTWKGGEPMSISASLNEPRPLSEFSHGLIGGGAWQKARQDDKGRAKFEPRCHSVVRSRSQKPIERVARGRVACGAGICEGFARASPASAPRQAGTQRCGRSMCSCPCLRDTLERSAHDLKAKTYATAERADRRLSHVRCPTQSASHAQLYPETTLGRGERQGQHYRGRASANRRSGVSGPGASRSRCPRAAQRSKTTMGRVLPRSAVSEETWRRSFTTG